MQRQLLSSLAALSFFSLVASRASYECVSGINYALYNFNFASDTNASAPELDYYTKTCQNSLLITSTWAAAKLYCTPREIISGQNYLNITSCEEYGLMSMIPYDAVSSNLTDEFINSLQVVTYEDITNDALIMFNTSILLSKELAYIGIDTVSAWDEMMLNHKSLGWANYGFWGLVLLAGILNRFITHIRGPQSNSSDIEGSSSPKSLSGPVQKTSHWVRTNLIIPATFGTYRQRLFYWCTVTTRLETIVIVLYYILNFLGASLGYNVFSPNLYYTTKLQAWRYFSDRTGIMCYANLPLLWMFSGRNNIFIWATGWSFNRFNIFHRHIARVAVVQAIAHSIGYTALAVIDGGKAELIESWKENYWYMGGLATVAMSFLLVFSSIYIRLKSYEVFLIIHIVFSIMTIVGLFYHTHVFTDHSWDPYLWPLVAIWSFDRLVRLIRQAYVNLHVGTKGLKTTTGEAVYDANADLITLTVRPAGKMLVPGNGQHYFIYQYNRWRGWENHPFSLASWTGATSSSSDSASSFPVSVIHEIPDKETGAVVRSSSTNTSLESPHPNTNKNAATTVGAPTSTTLTFYIRPVRGFTARLKQQCLSQPSAPISLHLILEGPYGHPFASEKYPTLLLVAGGSGIAGVLPFLRQKSRNTNQPRIKLLWATKRAVMISTIIARERGGEFDLIRGGVDLDLHVTRENGAAKKEESGAVIKNGRPEVKKWVREQVLAAAGGKVAVVVCGPAGMADEGRDAVHSLLKEGVSGVEYVEESFGW